MPRFVLIGLFLNCSIKFFLAVTVARKWNGIGKAQKGGASVGVPPRKTAHWIDANLKYVNKINLESGCLGVLRMERHVPFMFVV